MISLTPTVARHIRRSTARAVAAVLLTVGWSGPVAAETKVVVTPFLGRAGAACAAQMARSLQGKIDDAVIEPGRSRPPRVNDYGALRRWFEDQVGLGVDVWIVGTVSPSKVVLEVYEADGADLIGIGQFRQSRRYGCRLRSSDRSRLIRWVRRVPVRKREDRLNANGSTLGIANPSAAPVSDSASPAAGSPAGEGGT